MRFIKSGWLINWYPNDSKNSINCHRPNFPINGALRNVDVNLAFWVCGSHIIFRRKTREKVEVRLIQQRIHWKKCSVVVIVCGNSSFIRQFMLIAYHMGMTNGDYVFISYNQLPPDNIRTLWKNNDSADPEARAAYAKLLTVRTLQPLGT